MSTFACLQDEKSQLNPNEMVKQPQSRDTCSISASKPKPLPLPPAASSSPALRVLHRRAPAAASLPSLHPNLCWVEREEDSDYGFTFSLTGRVKRRMQTFFWCWMVFRAPIYSRVLPCNAVAVLLWLRDDTRWPRCAQHCTRIIQHKRFALNVMKQMTKSINLEWCGYHKNDVNSEFTVVMKLFRIIIKTSAFFFFFQNKSSFDNHRWMLQEIFNKCIQN